MRILWHKGEQVSDADNKEFLDQIEQLLASQRVGVLATRYQKTPHQSLIAYISSGDLREIFFVSPLYTRKVMAIEKDPRVALLVDSRQNMEKDFDACIAVTAKGTVERLPEQRLEPFLSQYLDRHPYLQEFVSSPSCGYFLLHVRSYSLVSRFQQVEELSLP